MFSTNQQPSFSKSDTFSTFLVGFLERSRLSFWTPSNEKKAQHWFEQTHWIAFPVGLPPTLLEDGQRYRGDQLKQGLDGGEVLGLDGENVQHLKRQVVTSGPFERRK